MKYNYLTLLFGFALLFSLSVAAQEKEDKQRKQLYKDGVYNPFEVLDTRVDKMKYWREAARLGLTPLEPQREIPLGKWKGSRIAAKSVAREDSPDVPVTTENSTQSENSIFINPNDPDHVLQSNNSTQNPVGQLYGANYFFSMDFGLTWGGSIQGAGGGNSGDPATAISLSGRQYVGYISSGYGQGVSYSDDGVNWTPVIADPGAGSSILDKNHLWIDNSPTSPYEGNVYVAWTDFGGSNDSEIEVVYTNNNGISYSNAVNISSAVNAGSHNQGVNIQTGPDGQVYAVWSIYDGFPTDETALGFAKSLNGGATWLPATRIISNTRGIRSSEVGKNMRVNSFPSMTVDLGGDGTIYIVWANIGVPGVNVGPDTDIYMIKSSDEGATWSAPIRVNQDPAGVGSKHYFPWITCDPETGALSVIFYDDRNVGGNKCEVFCANSFDGGETWEDFRVSDVDFTPAPIPGLAGGYMGDYLGIAARGGKVYPVWTDNRSGVTMTYTSPYETNSLPRPIGLTAGVTFETGQVDMEWEFEPVPTFEYFIVYRDGFEVGTTTETTFSDLLPDYGVYKFKVTAMHTEGESSGPSATVQWGDAHIAVDPAEIIEFIDLMSTSTRYITVENVGELDLIFNVSSSTEPIRQREYCTATTSTQDEYIANVSFGDINNSSNWQGGVADYTDLSTTINVGESESIVVTNGNAWTGDIVYVWVDWNDNMEFEVGTDEEFPLTNVGGQGQTFTGEITVPQGTPSGEHRMRVRMTYSSPPEPCGSATYGEVEDYTVNVLGWMLVPRIVDTIAPGNTQTIEIMFDSQELEQGTYYGNVMIESNDPDLPAVNVPVTLNVGGEFPLSINVSASPSTICLGTTSQLQADANGGTGVYTYEWTSDPPGFSSTIANPVVSPDETTTYFVTVDDGEDFIDGEITVNVVDVPQQAAMPQGETDPCMGVLQTVYSTTGAPGATGYNWIIEPATAGTINTSGLTATITWDETFAGSATLMVQGYNSCGNGDMSDMMEITMHELPTVDLGADLTVCANESVILDAGNPGATYLWSTGETTQTITVDTTGVGIGTATFWVEVTDGNTCENSDEITIQFDDCTGISELTENWTVNIFPNPSNGIFSIKISSLSNKPASLKIMNTLGTVVYQSNINVDPSKTMDIKLTNQPEGIYYLNLKGEGVNLIKKVIIQK
jgi:hypothetical protein